MKATVSDMPRVQLSAWNSLMAQWRVKRDSEQWHERVIASYSEPHRRYHTTRHLSDCLKSFDAMAADCRAPEQVEMALWFHDVIYDPRSDTNEESSAVVFESFADEFALDEISASNVSKLILCTMGHLGGESDPDIGVLLDCDLEVLGRPPSAYSAYATAVREEYAWVSDRDFKVGRTKVLTGILDRPWIYNSPTFRDRFEAQARRNLQQEIKTLLSHEHQ